MSTATYLKIAAHLRDQIIAGQLAPGEPIPSLNEIVETHGVARATAAKAIDVIHNEGLIERSQGQRSVVKTAAPVYRRAEDRLRAGRATGRFMQAGEGSAISEARITSDVPGAVRAELGLTEGEPAICRHRITSRDGVVVEVSTSWFPASLAATAPLLVGKERIPGGTSAYISKQMQRSFETASERVSVRLATSQEAAELERPEPLPVMVTEHIANIGDETLVYEVGLCPPGYSSVRTYEL